MYWYEVEYYDNVSTNKIRTWNLPRSFHVFNAGIYVFFRKYKIWLNYLFNFFFNSVPRLWRTVNISYSKILTLFVIELTRWKHEFMNKKWFVGMKQKLVCYSQQNNFNIYVYKVYYTYVSLTFIVELLYIYRFLKNKRSYRSEILTF